MSGDKTLLIVEDDVDFARTLKRSFERRGYAVTHVETAAALEAYLSRRDAGQAAQFAVVDLKLGQESGLACIKAIARHTPATVIVVLTGFASIATAVEAIKLGASNYLPKPANSDEIEAAFHKMEGDTSIAVGSRPTRSVKTIEWEHIHQTLVATDFNISEAARRLGMHRRTLARKLEKRRIT